MLLEKEQENPLPHAVIMANPISLVPDFSPSSTLLSQTGFYGVPGTRQACLGQLGRILRKCPGAGKLALCGHTKTWKSVLNARFGYTLCGEDMDSVGGIHEHGDRRRDSHQGKRDGEGGACNEISFKKILLGMLCCLCG